MDSLQSDFQDLLEQSKRLTNHIVPNGFVAPERGLEQIEKQTKRLLQRAYEQSGSTAGATQPQIDPRAAFMLASKGFDADRVRETIDQINLALTFEPLQAVHDTDIEGYLRNEHETIVSNAIQDQKTQTVADFEKYFALAIERDWQKAKLKIMEEMGHSNGAQGFSDVDIDTSNVALSKDTEPAVSFKRNSRLSAYVDVVKAINEARMNQTSIDVVAAFAQASSTNSDDSNQQFITKCWELLGSLLGTAREVKPMGSFMETYAKTGISGSSQDVIKLRSDMIYGARSWLETDYRNWVSEHIRAQRYEIGGMPTIDTEVDAILKLRFMKGNRWSVTWFDFTINGKVPFWAHLYALVRMGKLNDASKYVKLFSNELGNSKDKNFELYFSSWIESGLRLSHTLRNKLLGEWNSGIRDYVSDLKSSPKGDAFKYALYKIIGRCELGIKNIRNNDVISSTDDYLWLQLMLVQEEILVTDGPQDTYTLRNFSSRIQKYGIQYFQTTTMWFMVLLLSQEFEKAVNELYKDPYFLNDAVHFGIALSYYGVLRVVESPNSFPEAGNLVSTKHISIQADAAFSVYYFHFTRLISKFVRKWAHTDPVDMLNYIYHIGIYGSSLDSIKMGGDDPAAIRGKEYSRFVYQAIGDILAESSLYSQMLGHIGSDSGQRIPGHVEHFRSLIHLDTEKQYLYRIVYQAAENSDKASRYQDAIHLYHLGSQYNKVVQILNRRLGDYLLQENIQQPHTGKKDIHDVVDTNFPRVDSNPIEAAEQILFYYQSNLSTALALDPKIVLTCSTLIKLYRFREQVNQGRDDTAVDLFYGLALVPDSADMNETQSKAEAFKELDDSVARVMPHMIMLCSKSLFSIYKSSVSAHIDSSARQNRLSKIKQRSKSLLMFVGLVEYRIPQDILAKINQYDVLMS